MFGIKRGAITQQGVIFFIVVILGFAIAAASFAGIASQDLVNREACRKSIETRGAIPDLAGVVDTKGITPLQCKTKKFCVTDNRFFKGVCEGIGFRHDNVRVGKDNAAQQNAQIVKFLADEMVECWNVMGEGNFQIFSNEIALSTINNACIVCSRIGFEEEIQEGVPNILGLSNFMVNNNAPNRLETYYEYLPKSRAGDPDDAFTRLISLSYDRLRSSREKSIVYIEGDATGLIELGGVASALQGNLALAAVLMATPDYFSSLVLVDTEDIDQLECDSFENLP